MEGVEGPLEKSPGTSSDQLVTNVPGHKSESDQWKSCLEDPSTESQMSTSSNIPATDVSGHKSEAHPSKSCLEDLQLQILMQRLKLLTCQLELAAMRCELFTRRLETYQLEAEAHQEPAAETRGCPSPTTVHRQSRHTREEACPRSHTRPHRGHLHSRRARMLLRRWHTHTETLPSPPRGFEGQQPGLMSPTSPNGGGHRERSACCREWFRQEQPLLA